MAVWVEVGAVFVIFCVVAGGVVSAFGSLGARAHDAAAVSTLADARTALVGYSVEHGGFPEGRGEDLARLRAIQPSVRWHASGGIRTPLVGTEAVGLVAYERPSGEPEGVVFGTRSGSGKCFYAAYTGVGREVRHGTTATCNDPAAEYTETGGFREGSW